MVNRVGKYLYKRLSGAIDYKQSTNTADVFTLVLYQDPGYREDMQEMTININVTTYQNKIRVNTIEVSPSEKTLGFDLFEPYLLLDPEQGTKLIYQAVCKRIVKEYKDYKFLF